MMMSMNECLRCGWRWESRIEGRPKNCPGCKSPVWDRPKVSNRVAATAGAAVAAAVRSGTLKKMPCEVCGDIKAEAHHEDYDKPLDIRWLCRKHHRGRHKEIGGPLMQGGLNLRGVPRDLVDKLKDEAAEIGVSLQKYCLNILARAVNPLNSVNRDGDISIMDEGELGRSLGRTPEKKSRESSAGAVVATEVGGTPRLPPLGKAQGGPKFDNPRDIPGNTVVADREPVESFPYGRSGVAPDFNEVHVPVIYKPRSPGITDLVVGPGDTCEIPLTTGKPDMQLLRDICAGKILAPQDWAAPLTEEQVDDPGFGEVVVPAPLCSVCEQPMEESKGKWACGDESCAMYGKVQKGKK
jgi:hypothetical protein